MQAAKAGVLAFFDTLRVEVGDSVGITIVMPGWIESEITKGKMHQEHGEIGVNQAKRDVRILPQLDQSYSAYLSVSYIVSPKLDCIIPKCHMACCQRLRALLNPLCHLVKSTTSSHGCLKVPTMYDIGPRRREHVQGWKKWHKGVGG